MKILLALGGIWYVYQFWFPKNDRVKTLKDRVHSGPYTSSNEAYFKTAQPLTRDHGGIVEKKTDDSGNWQIHVETSAFTTVYAAVNHDENKD